MDTEIISTFPRNSNGLPAFPPPNTSTIIAIRLWKFHRRITECQRTAKPSKCKIKWWIIDNAFPFGGKVAKIYDFCRMRGYTPCYARHFDLLRNSPLSSIRIHFGVELLVFGASLTSASLSKNDFFDRLKNHHPSGGDFCKSGILNVGNATGCIRPTTM